VGAQFAGEHLSRGSQSHEILLESILLVVGRFAHCRAPFAGRFVTGSIPVHKFPVTCFPDRSAKVSFYLGFNLFSRGPFCPNHFSSFFRYGWCGSFPTRVSTFLLAKVFPLPKTVPVDLLFFQLANCDWQALGEGNSSFRSFSPAKPKKRPKTFFPSERFPELPMLKSISGILPQRRRHMFAETRILLYRFIAIRPFFF